MLRTNFGHKQNIVIHLKNSYLKVPFWNVWSSFWRFIYTVRERTFAWLSLWFISISTYIIHLRINMLHLIRRNIDHYKIDHNINCVEVDSFQKNLKNYFSSGCFENVIHFDLISGPWSFLYIWPEPRVLSHKATSCFHP